MNCASTTPLLSAYLDGELPVDTREPVDRHLEECPVCRTLLAEMQQLDQQLHREIMPQPQQVKQLTDATLETLAKQTLPYRPRAWRIVALSLASAAAGFLLALALLPEMIGVNRPVPSNMQPVVVLATNELPVQLALAIGVVEVEEQGGWKPLATGAKLQAGQRIRTQARSRCELRCSDGSEIRLNYGSDLIVHSPRQLHLKQGQVWSTVAADPAPFQIKTDQTTVTALGTQFDLDYQNQETTLTVMEGKTRMELAGKTAEVAAGQQLRLNNKQGTYDIRNPDYALYQATNWVHEILVLKGRNNPELNRRINDVMASIGETKMVYMAEEEIRTLGDHCVVPLCQFLQSPRSKGLVDRRQLAARIVADLSQPRAIGELIEVLGDEDGEVRASMAMALNRLTRHNQGLTIQQWKAADQEARKRGQAQWRQWWKNNQSRYPEAETN